MYAPLDLAGAGPESFIPILNSLYNLLAAKQGESPHPDHLKYLPEPSERVMIRRCRIEHRMNLKSFADTIKRNSGAEAVLMDLYTLALSNTLAGYVYRSVEEAVCKKKSAQLAESEKAQLINSMYAEYGSEMSKTLYGELRAEDVADGRLVLCLALRWKNRHLKYLLAEDQLQQKWWETVFSQNLALSLHCVEHVFRTLRLLSEGKSLSENNTAAAVERAEQDLIHGYIVKLSESLVPL